MILEVHLIVVEVVSDPTRPSVVAMLGVKGGKREASDE